MQPLSYALDLWVTEGLDACLCPPFTVSFHYSFPKTVECVCPHMYKCVCWAGGVVSEREGDGVCQKDCRTQ